MAMDKTPTTNPICSLPKLPINKGFQTDHNQSTTKQSAFRHKQESETRPTWPVPLQDNGEEAGSGGKKRPE